MAIEIGKQSDRSGVGKNDRKPRDKSLTIRQKEIQEGWCGDDCQRDDLVGSDVK